MICFLNNDILTLKERGEIIWYRSTGRKLIPSDTAMVGEVFFMSNLSFYLLDGRNLVLG